MGNRGFIPLKLKRNDKPTDTWGKGLCVMKYYRTSKVPRRRWDEKLWKIKKFKSTYALWEVLKKIRDMFLERHPLRKIT